VREAVDVGPLAPPADTVRPARAPVVAVVDGGIAAHAWFVGPDGPLVADALELGWSPAEELDGPQVGNVDGDLRLDDDAGHGTFVAGLVRQHAPSARLLSVQAMDSDGFFPPRRALSALTWLLDRVRGTGGEPAAFVDVVCLAWGYVEDGPAEHAKTTELRAVLGELGEEGVQVVCAAGNGSDRIPVIPAALTRLADADSLPAVPLVSVGATNPDGSLAAFSSYGPWVQHYERGSALISAMPAGFGSPVEPAGLAGSREQPWAFDPNDMATATARWGGTSFAAAVVAGKLAQEIASDGTVASASREDVLARVRRARTSVLGWS
jgi:subtilisin family serine protease